MLPPSAAVMARRPSDTCAMVAQPSDGHMAEQCPLRSRFDLLYMTQHVYTIPVSMSGMSGVVESCGE